MCLNARRMLVTALPDVMIPINLSPSEKKGERESYYFRKVIRERMLRQTILFIIRIERRQKQHRELFQLRML